MDDLDIEIARYRALHAIATGLTRLKWLRDAERLTLAMIRHDRALKAGFNPEQPRDELGRWTDEGGDSAGLDRLEQPLATASDQAERGDLSGLKDIVNNAKVRAQIDEAWNASIAREGSPREHGFWITKNKETGDIATRPFSNEGSARSIVPGPAPDDAIAFFHTHPNRPEDDYRQGPSEGDERFAARTGLPGLIQSHHGMYYFGPSLKAPAKR